jgi:hypothetical protein
MRQLCFLIALVVLCSQVSRGQESPVPGAKDLFYDPSQGTTASVRLPPPVPPKEEPKHGSGMKKEGPAPMVHRSSSPRPATKTSAPQNRGLHSWIELQEPDGKWSYVSNQEIFRSGERIRLHFVSNVDGRILLIQLGASGSSSILFPDPGKGLMDNQLKAGVDRMLPTTGHWFRFDANPGTERLIALFASDSAELERFPVKPEMRPSETTALMQVINHHLGSKDLVIETETRTASEVGTYGVNLQGNPVILEISLQHR